MFEIKDYIIITLVLLLLFFIYKYYSNYNQSKEYDNKINDLNKEINLLKKNIDKNKNIIDTNLLTDSSKSSNSSNSSNTDSDDYISHQMIETFNNNTNNVCNNSVCYTKPNNDNTLDNLVKSDIYIPVDFKSIINQIYDITTNNEHNDETISDYLRVEEIHSQSSKSLSDQNSLKNSSFNPLIIEHNNDDNNKSEVVIMKDIPNFINIPDNLDNVETINNEESVQKENINETNMSETNNKTIISENIISDINTINQNNVEQNNSKLEGMKISEIKNLARTLNIKITNNGKPKNRELLISEINNKQNNSIII